MKKNFLQPKRRKDWIFKAGGLILALLAAFFILNSGIARSYFSYLNSYFLRGGGAIQNAFIDFQKNLVQKSSLRRELQHLSELNSQLINENAFLKERLKELTNIENLLENRPLPEKLAVVLSQAPQSPYDTILVDRGSDDGIQTGLVAVGFGSILLGEVTRVYPITSEIELFSYPGRKTEAWLPSLSLNIILEGMGGSNFKFSVPKNLDIKVGERVLADSREGYLIGQVEYIRKRPNEPLQDIIVGTPLNLRHLRLIELRER